MKHKYLGASQNAYGYEQAQPNTVIADTDNNTSFRKLIHLLCVLELNYY